MKSTALIILNFNNYEDTINCIESVEKYNSAPIKLIVVDNASTAPGASEALRDYLIGRYKDQLGVYNDVTVKDVKSDCNLSYCSLILSAINDGYARGNNKGLRLAYADNSVNNILILNNDVLFVEDIIPVLQEDLQLCDKAAIISPILYKKDLSGLDYNCCRKALSLKDIFVLYLFQFNTAVGLVERIINNRMILKKLSFPLKNKMVEMDLPSGSCMFIDKTLFRSIGSFDPNTFLYCEEDILYKKVSQRGLINYLDTSIKCIHLGASSTSSSPSMFIQKCGINSNLYYLRNYTVASCLYMLCMSIFCKLMLLKTFIKTLYIKYSIR